MALNVVIKTLLWLMFVISASCHASLPKEVTMAFVVPEEKSLGKLGRAIFTEAFKQLNVKLTIKHCSPLKCSLLLKTHQVDGDLGRTIYFEKLMPEAMRTTESVINLDYAAYYLDEAFYINSLDELKAKPYKVAARTEDFVMNEFIKNEMSDNIPVIKVIDWKSGLYKLRTGEADIYIGSVDLISEELKKIMP